MNRIHESQEENQITQEIVTRKYAIDHGLKRYFTGKPCLNGHVAPRKTHSHACVECARRLMNHARHPSLNGEAPALRSGWKKSGVSEVRVNGELFDFSDQDFGRDMRNKSRVKNHNSRARRKMVSGRHDFNDIMELLRMQFWRCGNWRCQVDLNYSGSHIDHIVPIAKGGTNWPDNLQMLCPSCNLRKSDTMPEDFF